MLWSKDFIHRPRYVYVSTNQHGDRYKRTAVKAVSVATLTADIDDAHDLKILILLSHHLDVPVQCDFEGDPQTAFIEVIGRKSLKD